MLKHELTMLASIQPKERSSIVYSTNGWGGVGGELCFGFLGFRVTQTFHGYYNLLVWIKMCGRYIT